MKKDERLQVRVSAEQAEFLREYSASRNITISQMMRDFINWLLRREQEKWNGPQRAEEDSGNRDSSDL